MACDEPQRLVMAQQFETIAIIGVGLIGGSIALGARERGLCGRIVGVTREPGSLPEGLVDVETTFLEEAAPQSQLILVCTPPRLVERSVRYSAQAAKSGTILTDVASTKSTIVEKLPATLGDKCHFVGAHPLAGSHETGAGAADGDLFVGSRLIITPKEDTNEAAVAEVSQFWTELGAEVFRMSALQHDQRLACSSHLPHVIASALAASTPQEALPFTAGGWRDTTRVASASPELWADILLQNQAAVFHELAEFGTCLDEFRSALEAGDREALVDCFRKGKDQRDALGS